MSVVGSDFEELKQFNLAEIYDPTPKPDTEKTKNTRSEANVEDGPRRANTSSPEPQLERLTNVIPNHLASEDKELAPVGAE